MTQARTIAAQVKGADLVADRRAHIASAAARVFRAKGFHNATIRDVAIAAGLSQGSLYNYVRSKDDILYLVHQDLTAGYAAYVEQAIAGIVEPRARLRAALAAFTHAMAERHADITLIYQETHALGDESRRAVLAQTHHVIQRFEQLIADARAAGMALPGAGRLAADIVTFLPVMLALRRWRLRDALPRDAAEAELVGFLLRGLGIEDDDV
ncbi:TetR/AcrR family transcriptional regulator [Rhodovarius sp.]|uniref:TetR/AcrR family transcriptional regulator n=1 Tax=Rhodovarius sp. TaxID=2972673 RepID=UPI0033416733